MANLGFMQMKKTHDAAMVIVERLYGSRPRYNYYIGSSQGGREALTVAQRYPADYDGVSATVPIVGFSSLMLAPELIRIQEKPQANWVTPAAFANTSAPAFRAKPGRTVVLALTNRANIATVFHLHGHHFRLLDRLDDGWKPFWLDTLAIEPGATQHVAFAAEHAGRWLIESARRRGENTMKSASPAS